MRSGRDRLVDQRVQLDGQPGLGGDLDESTALLAGPHRGAAEPDDALLVYVRPRPLGAAHRLREQCRHERVGGHVDAAVDELRPHELLAGGDGALDRPDRGSRGTPPPRRRRPRHGRRGPPRTGGSDGSCPATPPRRPGRPWWSTCRNRNRSLLPCSRCSSGSVLDHGPFDDDFLARHPPHIPGPYDKDRAPSAMPARRA